MGFRFALGGLFRSVCKRKGDEQGGSTQLSLALHQTRTGLSDVSF